MRIPFFMATLWILSSVSCQATQASDIKHTRKTSYRFSVDISSREQTRNFHNGVYQASRWIPSGWQGDISLCEAGQTSDAYQTATRLRVNYYRAMAGVPADITFDDTLSAKARDAALMMSANNSLSHYPTTDWPCHTPDGTEAAGNSNLALGSAGPVAVDNLMFDWGDNNAAVGHRRWILFPGTRIMGLGNVEPPKESNYAPAQALWIVDQDAWTRTRPVTRNPFVSWPPAGFLPRSLAPERWSFSCPNADFSRSTVTVRSAGETLATTLEPVMDGFGDNTLVWITERADQEVTGDTRYTVTIDNVGMEGKTSRFEYEVILFDPARYGDDTVLPAITKGPLRVKQGAKARYTLRKVPGASDYQWLAIHALPYNVINDAESGLGDLSSEPAETAYPILNDEVYATGQMAYHLAQTDETTQTLLLQGDFIPGSQSVLKFSSRLGWATREQAADVELSTDQGLTWTTVHHQTGTDSKGESSFSPKTIDLSPYLNRLVRIRFHYGSEKRFYPQTSAGVGWYIDDIRLSKVLKAQNAPQPNPAKTNQFTFAPPTTGQYFLGTRAMIFGQYPLEWTPLKPVKVLSP